MKSLLVLVSFLFALTTVSGDTFSTGATTNVVPGSLDVNPGPLRVNGVTISTNAVVTTNFVQKTGDTMTGTLKVPVGSAGDPSIGFAGNTNTGFFSEGSNQYSVSLGGSKIYQYLIDGRHFCTVDGARMLWGASSDLITAREGAGILGIRNGTSPSEFRIYNTFTDTSNYERAYGRWSGNVFTIGTEGAGTGTNRVLQIMFGTNVLSFSGTNLTWNGTAITVP